MTTDTKIDISTIHDAAEIKRAASDGALAAMANRTRPNIPQPAPETRGRAWPFVCNLTSLHQEIKMGNIAVISAPQGAGKTRKAGALASALGCIMICDNWDGKTDHGISVLYLTNRKTFVAPAGATVITANDTAALDALLVTA